MSKMISGVLGLVLSSALSAAAVTNQSGVAMQEDQVALQLSSARAKQASGEHSAAQTILIHALYALPDSAGLLDALGSVQQDMGKYLEAESNYLRALNASSRANDNEERIFVLNNLGTLYLETSQYSKGEKIRAELEKFAPRVLQAHSVPFARVLNIMGSLEHERGRDQDAIRDYTRALQIFHEAEGPVSADAASVENNLGLLEFEARRYQPAASFFRQSFFEIQTANGSDATLLIRSQANLALCLDLTGDLTDAEPLARRAVELSHKLFGDEHPVTATAMLEQAHILRQLQCKREARNLERRAKNALLTTSSVHLRGYTVDLRDIRAAR